MSACTSSSQCGYNLDCIYDSTASLSYCRCTSDRFWDTSSTSCCKNFFVPKFNNERQTDRLGTIFVKNGHNVRSHKKKSISYLKEHSKTLLNLILGYLVLEIAFGLIFIYMVKRVIFRITNPKNELPFDFIFVYKRLK